MSAVQQTIQSRLFALQDLKYQAFQSKLIPTICPDTVIGVRMPALRKLAKELSGTPEATAFLQQLPHAYYEENNLHGLLICQMKDYDQTIAAVDAFLPHIDNWATCDLLSPKVFRAHLPDLYEKIQTWVHASHPYTIRFGIGMLMSFYLDQAFSPAYPALVAEIRSDEYYVNMMIAWYFATALAKQYEAVLPYLQQHRLARWTHNKAIQRAIESDRITAEQKLYLRTLKQK